MTANSLPAQNIPKVIHYCWFGHNPKNNLIQTCMASWKKFCPDWEIREWTEDDWDVTRFPYTQEAYDAKKWAFVSDVARLDILFRNGGVYLDTDVELTAPLDPLLQGTGFLFYDTEIHLATGLGFGAVAGNPLIGAMLEDYRHRHFIKKDGSLDMYPCLGINTEALRAAFPHLPLNGTDQIYEGFRLLSTGTYHKYAKNHHGASWTETPKTEIVEDTTPYKRAPVREFLRKPERQAWIRTHFGQKVHGKYVFLVYDFLDFGPLHFVRRMGRRIVGKKRK